MIFWRIVDNKLHTAGEVNQLGFPLSDPSYIPDEYLENEEFVVMRTCFGIGDWGIISAMPRLLKEKYPNCKVYVPSPKMMNNLFNVETDISETIFGTNPYVDKFLDKYDGEIFHDQYRLYDELNDDIPLLDQILQFWQFDNIDWDNIRPEMYWSDDEQKLGDKIINNHCGNQKFGTFLISDRFGTRYGKFDQACFDNEHKLLTEKIGDYKLPYFYWSSKPIGDIPFELPNAVLDMKHMDLRIQLYIRSKGEVCIGNQSGVLQTISRYTELYMPQRQWPLGGNFVSGEHYMNIFDKNEILKNIPDKTESKTTTSLKFKSDLIDYFSNDKYRDYTVLEIGSSLGHSTHVLSFLFKTVTAVDNLPERHQISKKLNANRNNIDYVITDVYNRPWEFEPADVVFIDCVHDYIHVKKDIDNTLQSFEKPLIIFDDYGLFPELKLAIDEYVERGILKIETYLGAPIGTYYPKTQNKILKDWEGLVCRVV